MSETQNNPANEEKKAISIATVIEMLQSGMDRQQIADHFGLKPSQRDRLFDHKQLKGRRVHRPRPSNILEFIDDVPEELRQEEKDYSRKQKATSTEATGSTEGTGTTSSNEGIEETQGAM